MTVSFGGVIYDNATQCSNRISVVSVKQNDPESENITSPNSSLPFKILSRNSLLFFLQNTSFIPLSGVCLQIICECVVLWVDTK